MKYFGDGNNRKCKKQLALIVYNFAKVIKIPNFVQTY